MRLDSDDQQFRIKNIFNNHLPTGTAEKSIFSHVSQKTHLASGSLKKLVVNSSARPSSDLFTQKKPHLGEFSGEGEKSY